MKKCEELCECARIFWYSDFIRYIELWNSACFGKTKPCGTLKTRKYCRLGFHPNFPFYLVCYVQTKLFGAAKFLNIIHIILSRRAASFECAIPSFKICWGRNPNLQWFSVFVKMKSFVCTRHARPRVKKAPEPCSTRKKRWGRNPGPYNGFCLVRNPYRDV